MKTYDEQNYKHSQPVHVVITLSDNTVIEFDDEIKGLNAGHALYLASKNWPDAVITIA